LEILTNLHKKILTVFSSLHDADSFCFTGGTALSAFFLNHRRSEDLDFFTSTGELISPFSYTLESALRNENLKVEKVRGFSSFTELFVSSSNESTVIHIALDAPFRLENTITSDEFPRLRIDSLKDISTNKLLALFGRANFKDFVDVYFIVQNHYTRKELAEFAKQKDPGFDLYWLGIAFERMENFAGSTPEMHLLVRPCTMQKLKEFFRDWRKEIIGEIRVDKQ